MRLIPYYRGWLRLEGKCELDAIVISMHTEFRLHYEGHIWVSTKTQICCRMIRNGLRACFTTTSAELPVHRVFHSNYFLVTLLQIQNEKLLNIQFSCMFQLLLLSQAILMEKSTDHSRQQILQFAFTPALSIVLQMWYKLEFQRNHTLKSTKNIRSITWYPAVAQELHRTATKVLMFWIEPFCNAKDNYHYLLVVSLPQSKSETALLH